MTFEAKVTAANALLASRGVPRPAYAPTIVTTLRRAGLRIRPPHFIGFLPILLFTAVLSGGVWGVVMWLLWWSRHDTPAVVAVGASAAVGIVAGLAAASYYRSSARRLALPRWEELTPD